ncbi:G-protein coupled receptor 161-like [Actinia tenebrosa]|uniref:G-protein coupled receptor 161-like n=1 Tax=Actinia tenebrosa TaxID=6105 RepID=A0A6P8HKK0_ACTTE|nr:G-protein coupled receptor 161-like [Actinia tenebrosa]XP_031556327.1 G-protein coupled receptor 161-like [Actinia tenebrosa]XP_031556328.1 G-protein coupled receptor 161-like [Actinia tenebrosa]
MGNVTRIPLNETGNGTNIVRQTPQVIDRVPSFRPGQTLTAVAIQLGFALALIVAALTINIMMAIVLNKKFMGIPYMMLKNIVAVDIATALLNGPFFALGVILDSMGIIIKSYCNVQGFFHASLSAVFLNTVTLIAVSRCLAVLKPQLYHKIFVNKITMHILLLAVWSSSSLLCVPPLNTKGWGKYDRFEATCWMAWIPENDDYIAYNSLLTILTLGTAVVSCSFGLYFLYSIRKVGSVTPAQTATAPPPYPGTANMSVPEKTSQKKVRLNTDVFIIASTQFAVYIVLWVPLTVMNSIYLKDWRDIEFRVITFFLFVFMGRTIINPILCLVVSADIRREFAKTIFRCRCKRDNETSEQEL